MEKVLTQQEIDAMVRAFRSGGRTEDQRSQQPRIELWDARRAGQIGREQLQAITLLHEGFARNLTHSLGAYLRIVFSATLVSAENLPYREFLQRIPEITYLASCRLDPMGVSGVLQLDLKVAFPIIDLLLGGEGTGGGAAREITEIEEQILESVARVICRELGVAWQAVSLQVTFDQRVSTAEAQRLLPPEEKTLCLSFEIIMPDARGGLNLAVPAAASNALLRKISAAWSYRQPQAQAGARQVLMRHLQDCPFEAELSAQGVRTDVSQLAGLVPGRVLTFRRNAGDPASLLVAGVEMFRALPSRRGNARLATLLERPPKPYESEEKTPA
ncbi:MAG TPA: FliM/FliN family flagellar motor switch protein [Candidatus Sulfotelmatobacter sp.]